MRLTYDADQVKMPLRSDLKKKHEQIKALRDRGMTNVSLNLFLYIGAVLMKQEEIQRQIDHRKRFNPSATRSKTVIQVTQLIASRQLALRRDDFKDAEHIREQIIALGADPVSGRPLGEVENDQADEEAEARAKAEKEEKKRRALQTAKAAAMLKRRAEESKR